MSLKTLILIAGVIAGTLALGNTANAQITGVTTGGYSYSPSVVTTPAVVTTSYYAPVAGWSYYSSPAYYSTPYMSPYAVTPYYSGYYNYPYYGGYSYYRAGIVGVGPRRWWWR